MEWVKAFALIQVRDANTRVLDPIAVGSCRKMIALGNIMFLAWGPIGYQPFELHQTSQRQRTELDDPAQKILP